jgi:hypothetical protein
MSYKNEQISGRHKHNVSQNHRKLAKLSVTRKIRKDKSFLTDEESPILKYKGWAS